MPASEALRRRIPAIDCARGVALIGMVVFHLAWDLHDFGFSTVDPNADAVLHGLGRTVAGAFLFLSGFSLVLAAEAGATLGREVTRLVRIGSAALVVTLATWLLAPAQVILFGILHCVFATNCAALALRRRPFMVVVAFAAVGLGLPTLLRGTLSGPVWTWLGLGVAEPETLDFRPFFPWIGLVLLGVAAARTPVKDQLGRWQPRSIIPRWLGAVGRHSLSIYLAHQPVVFVVLSLVASATGVSQKPRVLLSNPAEAAAFLQQCSASCIAKGKEPHLCRSTCHCVMTDLLGRRQDAMHEDSPERLVGQPSRTCLAQDEGQQAQPR